MAGVLSERRVTLVALAAIVTLTAIAWGSALGGAFQFDDLTNVVGDSATSNVGALLDRLSHGARPLTRLTYFADAHIVGMRAVGFLATNLILHVATALLVFALARRRVEVAGAAFAALVFALQPANGEVVAYVSGRSTGLMTPLLLAGLLLHARGQRAGALVAFVLACLAKEVALAFPLLVIVWDASGGESWRRALRSAALYFVTAGAMLVLLLVLARYRTLLAYSLELRSVPDNLVANGRAMPRMLSLWVRPWALSADHDFVAIGHTAWGLAGIGLLGAALGAGAVIMRTRYRAVGLAIVWPIVALLPTSSILAKLDLVTEKPLYLAWVGPAIALGIAFTAVRARAAACAVAAVVVVAMAAGSMWRAAVWSVPIRVWREASAGAPGKARCWNNLGAAYLDAKRDAEAFAAFERAVMLDPGNRHATTNLEIARMLCGSRCTRE